MNLHLDKAILSQVSYETMIDIICKLGNIPASWIDQLTAMAHKQIYDTLKVADGSRKERMDRRTAELWGGINEERQIFKSCWFDYEEENLDNFLED